MLLNAGAGAAAKISSITKHLMAHVNVSGGNLPRRRGEESGGVF